MTPQEYIDKVNEFAGYKRYDLPFYPIFLLIEELHELKEHIENCSDTDKIILELGDILWATTAIAIESRIDLCSFINQSCWFDCYFTDPKIDILKETREMLDFVEKFCGRIHKFLRNDPDTAPMWGALVGGLIGFIISASGGLDASLCEVAKKNVEKLTDRRKRNSLHGDGDNR